MTHQTHTAEYFLIDETIKNTNYTQARLQNEGGITAPFYCPVNLQTIANQKGSLIRRDQCGTIRFDKARPLFWSLPVPIISFPNFLPLTQCGYKGCVFLNPQVSPRTCSQLNRCAAGAEGYVSYTMHKVADNGSCLAGCYYDVQSRLENGYVCGTCAQNN